MTSLFELKKTSFVRQAHDREIRVLDEVDFVFPDVPIFAVMGASGSGKSTLLRLLNRLESFTGGDILFKGESLTSLPVTRLRFQVGMLFQMPCLPEKTVRENLAYGPKLSGRICTDDYYEDLLNRVDLDADILERDTRQFSVGQQQRLSLARVLANSPQVLLLDEPTASLDQATTLTIEATIQKIAAENKIHVIWVTHSLEQSRRLGHATAVIKEGKLTCAT